MKAGLLPTLQTNSKIYSFKHKKVLDGPILLASHGFDVRHLDLRGLGSLGAYGKLAGNCMSLPIVGAIQCAILAILDFGTDRLQFRAAGSSCIGSVPAAPAFTLALSDSDGESDAEWKSSSSSD